MREFQSVRDSGDVKVGDITCLVGKNEAGKSALLKALYRVNPVVPEEGGFDVTIDYPRMSVEDYRHDVETKKRGIANPIATQYELTDDEVEAIESEFGKCLKNRFVMIYKYYDNSRTFNMSVDEVAGLTALIKKADIPEPLRGNLLASTVTADGVLAKLTAAEATTETDRLKTLFTAISKTSVKKYIYDEYVHEAEPSYLYFDEYYQMTGHENIEALVQRSEAKALKSSDHPMLGLIRLARLKLPDLLNPQSTIDLKGKLEGASNHLTRQVLKYWSQNKHLKMTFDVRPGLARDPEGMRTGTNIWGGVFDSRHAVTTELGSRSRGFVWFFSFLAWYSDVKRDNKPVILLLDEPGLTLHAKAQDDLLRYFETELKGEHQLIYSTHSPFMIDAKHFDRVRIVQDASIDGSEDIGGTEVLKDVYAASEDSLFPLQAALGYEMHQSLFVGPYSLIVEGAADLLFIQTMSALLGADGRTSLDERWTVTPVGGASKIPTFVALLGSQKGMTIATLIDSQTSDQEAIEALYKEKLLKKANVITFADILDAKEADVEDMFGQAFYLQIVNAEFKGQLSGQIKAAAIKSKHPRLTKRLDEYFAEHPLKQGSFGHFRPARYFSENAASLKKDIPATAFDSFEKAFKKLNKLLD
ncbi:AAA family ATPase [Tardiphaga robiniae]|uniref:AAA family ATPase n=1 Tax=Tardiphaga robiniae TaxID=943830 RepID=UPI0030B8D331